MVTAKRLAADDLALLDPDAPEWRSAPPSNLALMPTPLGSQPTAYIRKSWQDRPHGTLDQITVAAAHNDRNIYFRLQWQDDSRDDVIDDTDAFADAAAVLFPLRGGDAILGAMGSPEEPVLGWYWRADMEEPLSVTAQGIGTTVRRPDGELESHSKYKEGAGWAVILSHRMRSHQSETVYLAPGQSGKVAFGVWRGSNSERAGLKAITGDWQPLEIEA
jgi:DMSO reductase family type II enzyme heme b subunit